MYSIYLFICNCRTELYSFKIRCKFLIDDESEIQNKAKILKVMTLIPYPNLEAIEIGLQLLIPHPL